MYTVVDLFTDVNGTTLDAHTPDTDMEGGGWNRHGSTFEIQDNQAATPSGGLETIATINAGAPNGEVVCNLKLGSFSSNDRIGVAFRALDNENLWTLEFKDEVLTADRYLELWKCVSNVWALADYIAFPTFDRDAWYELKVIFNVASIECYVNGTLYITVSDSQWQNATRVGLIQYNSTTARWDNFYCLRIDSGGSGRVRPEDVGQTDIEKETETGTGNLDRTTTFNMDYELLQALFHVSSASSNPVTISQVAKDGAAYNTVLFKGLISPGSDVLWNLEGKACFEKGDELRVVWTNDGGLTYGLKILVEGLFKWRPM